MKHKLMAAVLVGTMVMSTVGTTTVLAQENDKIELDMWVFGGLSAEPVVFQEMAENFNNSQDKIHVTVTAQEWSSRQEKIIVTAHQGGADTARICMYLVPVLKRLLTKMGNYFTG